MHKLILSIVLLSLVVLSACQPVEEIVDPIVDPTIEPIGDPDDVEETVGFVKSDLAKEINPDVSEDQVQALAQDNTAFALEFYNQIRDEDGNIIFSPFSLSLALSMTLAGADTTTEQAMLDALQLDLPEEAIHPAFNALLMAIEESQDKTDDEMAGDQFQLNIANSIWGQADFNFKQDFLDILAQHYEAGIFTVDYVQNPEGARNAINNWVAEETEGKIQDLIPAGAINPLTRLVLANAIYFYGSWMHPFDQNATSEAPFFTLDGSEISVDMMRLNGERFLYRQGDNYQVVNLPYMSSDFVMTILVPDAGSFDEVESSLVQADINELFSEMSFERVDLEMPKYDFETTINANDALIALGMEEAFDPNISDFKRIAEVEDLHITDVLHKATITVDEEGTEAAAATAVIVGVTSAPIDEPIALVIDRPFLFMIRHLRTNSILFMGRVVEP
jgi:serpin B